MKRSFSSKEVVGLTGITPRQLQWWDERGIVVPARTGRRRLYSVDDLAEITVIVEMRRKGFSLQRMRKIMRFLEREFSRRLVDTVRRGSDYHLLTDGRHIFLEDSAKRVVDVLKNCRQPVFSICLSDMVRQVHADIRGWRKKAQQSVTSSARGRQRRMV
jgi:DNA-binding transcriptional MerR regulator